MFYFHTNKYNMNSLVLIDLSVVKVEYMIEQYFSTFPRQTVKVMSWISLRFICLISFFICEIM